MLYEQSVYPAQVFFMLAFIIELLQGGGQLGEKGRPGVTGFQGSPMFIGPLRLAYHNLVNALMVSAALAYWDGQPKGAVSRHYAVAVAPIPFSELDGIVDDELIHRTQQIEIAFPGDIARLQYGYVFHGVIAFGRVWRGGTNGQGASRVPGW
jgi:hypothetical protein